MKPTSESSVLTCAALQPAQIARLVAPYGVETVGVSAGGEIPGSWFGPPEAGLIANRLYYSADTPVHSLLHELCHYICMSPQRREQLDTDAGGGYDEENGVCYLQILLADQLPGVGRRRMMEDMDAWGYTFRLGSAGRWFEEDAADALEWLQHHAIVDRQGVVSGRLRVERDC